MGRIIYFPPTYPDEDFRSIVSRYHSISAKTSIKFAKKELLGKLVPYKAMYPQNLSSILSDLEMPLDFANFLIYNHSFYPLVSVFSTKERQEIIKSEMWFTLSRKNISYKSLRGLISKEEKFCPECILKDYKIYGVAYLHRLHQLSFLRYCLIHGHYLITRCSTCQKVLFSQIGIMMINEQNCSHCGNNITQITSLVKIEPDQRLLEDVTTLMKYNNYNLDTLHLKILISIGSKNYIHFRGDYIYKRKLLEDFTVFYGEVYLSNLGIPLQELQLKKNQLFNKKAMHKNIIFYILLMRFLGGSVEKFLDREEIYVNNLPFGRGPWPCLNRICPYHEKFVILKIERNTHAWVSGRFTCPHCGFIYSRGLIPNSEENNMNYAIETMGHLLVSKLEVYLEMGLSKQHMAEKLCISTPTVYKYLRHLRNEKIKEYSEEIMLDDVLKEGGQEEKASVSMRNKSNVCKKFILQEIERLGNQAMRSTIRRKNSHMYDWLMKKEPEWMETYLPPKFGRKKIDREVLDTKISKLIKESIYKLYSKKPNERISISKILQGIPGNISTQYQTFRLDLPESRLLLESKSETIDAYCIRSVDRVVEWFKQSRYKTPTLNLIQHRFPLYKKCSEEVQNWVVVETIRQMKQI